MTKKERHEAFSEALDNLATLVPNGELLLATDHLQFLSVLFEEFNSLKIKYMFECKEHKEAEEAYEKLARKVMKVKSELKDCP